MQAELLTAGGLSLAARTRRRFFGLSADEATFARRGFRPGDERARQQLERVGESFLRGYNAALDSDDHDALALSLGRVPREFVGFAFEGAAMALALLDLLTPWSRSRWRTFAESHGRAHVYMMHVGLGWALARLGRRPTRHLARLDPLLGWLAVDGYGFHEGYFRWQRYVERRHVHARLGGYARRAFDQGLGRSIWFVRGADVRAVAATLDAFEPARRPDLWSGVGLAATYAGGAGRDELEHLLRASGEHRPQLAQGSAFAAKTRLLAGNVNEHTEEACRVFCGRTVAEASAVPEAALENLHDEGALPAYEVWRRRVQARLTKEAVEL
ncbi:MAG TPA: DUF1702 family protein [Pyrinomonadaceae bacterium]|nr:DUF1702 family protein [Pyrinomonadaceae bacterium]